MSLADKFSEIQARLRHPGSFLGPLLTLVSGTVVAHMITAVSLLLLARIYTPADFGVLGLFTGIFFIFSVVVCLRFDIAIPLPESEEEGKSLLVLALLSALGFGLLSACLVAVIPDQWLMRAGFGKILPHLWLLPVALIASGIFTALQSWAVRQKAYSLIARARIAQSAGAAVTQIAIGVATKHPVGLILGVLMNSLAGAVALVRQASRDSGLRDFRPSKAALLQCFRRNQSYPRYSVWEALANSASIQVPILLIGSLAGETELGLLLYAMAVIQAPVALLGTASAQVYSSRAPERARRGDLYKATLETVRSLAWAGVLPIIAIGLLSPLLFPALFGEQWERSGDLVLWMTPWFLFQFLASPTSMSLHIVGRHRLAMIVQLAGLALRTAAVLAASRTGGNQLSEYYALSGAGFYALLLAIGLWLAKRHDLSMERKLAVLK